MDEGKVDERDKPLDLLFKNIETNNKNVKAIRINSDEDFKKFDVNNVVDGNHVGIIGFSDTCLP